MMRQVIPMDRKPRAMRQCCDARHNATAKLSFGRGCVVCLSKVSWWHNGLCPSWLNQTPRLANDLLFGTLG